MQILTVREANQNFSRVIAEVERGETVVITKNGRPVARMTAHATDPADDPVWRSAYDKLVEHLDAYAGDGYRVGTITEDDKYGDVQL